MQTRVRGGPGRWSWYLGARAGGRGAGGCGGVSTLVAVGCVWVFPLCAARVVRFSAGEKVCVVRDGMAYGLWFLFHSPHRKIRTSVSPPTPSRQFNPHHLGVVELLHIC